MDDFKRRPGVYSPLLKDLEVGNNAGCRFVLVNGRLFTIELAVKRYGKLMTLLTLLSHLR